jgi:hypothetical protein
MPPLNASLQASVAHLCPLE